jgi:hypothetical protein
LSAGGFSVAVTGSLRQPNVREPILTEVKEVKVNRKTAYLVNNDMSDALQSITCSQSSQDNT